VTPEDKERAEAKLEDSLLKTKLSRPEILHGTTYKIKPRTLQHGLYITINNIEHEGISVPYEIFISTKNVELYHFLEVLTLTLTSLFRMQQHIRHLLDVYLDIPEIGGGYWSKPKVPGEKGKFYKSWIGEISDVIREHIDGLRTEPFKERLDEMFEEFLGEKEETKESISQEDSPKGTLCQECFSLSVVMLDGCKVCLACGNSKCS
jgi:hypothetical protein